MAKAMVQVHFPAGKPSLEEAAEALGLEAAELDPEFGVIATDPLRNLYTVRVDAELTGKAAAALESRASHPGEGVFGDVRIAPFGPPED